MLCYVMLCYVMLCDVSSAMSTWYVWHLHFLSEKATFFFFQSSHPEPPHHRGEVFRRLNFLGNPFRKLGLLMMWWYDDMVIWWYDEMMRWWMMIWLNHGIVTWWNDDDNMKKFGPVMANLKFCTNYFWHKLLRSCIRGFELHSDSGSDASRTKGFFWKDPSRSSSRR